MLTLFLTSLLVCSALALPVDPSRNAFRKSDPAPRVILDNDTAMKMELEPLVVKKNSQLLKDGLADDYDEEMYDDLNAPIIDIRFKRAAAVKEAEQPTAAGLGETTKATASPEETTEAAASLEEPTEMEDGDLKNIMEKTEDAEKEVRLVDNKTNTLRRSRKGKKSNRSLRKSNRRKNQRKRLRNRLTKNLS